MFGFVVCVGVAQSIKMELLVTGSIHETYTIHTTEHNKSPNETMSLSSIDHPPVAHHPYEQSSAASIKRNPPASFHPPPAAPYIASIQRNTPSFHPPPPPYPLDGRYYGLRNQSHYTSPAAAAAPSDIGIQNNIVFGPYTRKPPTPTHETSKAYAIQNQKELSPDMSFHPNWAMERPVKRRRHNEEASDTVNDIINTSSNTSSMF
eukprot:519728_1